MLASAGQGGSAKTAVTQPNSKKFTNATNRPPDIAVRYNALTNDRIATWRVKKTVNNTQKTETNHINSAVKSNDKSKMSNSVPRSQLEQSPNVQVEIKSSEGPGASNSVPRREVKQVSNIISQIEMYEKKDSQSRIQMKRTRTIKPEEDEQSTINHSQVDTAWNIQLNQESVLVLSTALKDTAHAKHAPSMSKTTEKIIPYEETGRSNNPNKSKVEDPEDTGPPMSVSSAIKAFQSKVQTHEEFTISKPTKKHEASAKEDKTQKYVPVTRKESSLKITVQPWGPRSDAEHQDSPRNTARTLETKPNVEEVTEEMQDLQVEHEEPEQSSDPDLTVETRKQHREDDETATDLVEESRASANFGSDTDASCRNSLSDEIEYNHPRAIDSARRDQRQLWMDVPAVIESGLLDRLEKNEKMKQEGKFEFMFSEATFLHTLNCLRSNFMSHFKKHIPQVLSQKDYNILFSNIMDIRDCSDKFLKELDGIWQEDLMLDGIYEIINKYAKDDFKVYVQFCKNMLEMSNHLTELTEKKAEFKSLLDMLINRQTTQKLTLDSFLTTPMQRITKMPLLMKTILQKVDPESEEHAKCVAAYDATCKIAQECDEVVNEKKKLEEILLLNQQLEFPAEVRSIPIVVQGRYLEARCDVKHFAFGDRNTKKEKLTLILFSDLLLVAKKVEGIRVKGEQLSVVDHCPRDQVQVRDMESGTLYNNAQATNQRVIIITLLNNSDQKKVDLMVTFRDPNMCDPWLRHFALAESTVQDSEQVIALQEYEAAENDELDLSPGDVIQVVSEDQDGWCYGEKLSDGTKGRFQLEKTAKITSQKQRMANMKLRKEMRQSQHSEDGGS